MVAARKAPIVKRNKLAMCPSCKELAIFTYQGTQEWPEQLVEKRGYPQTTELWTCPCCHTTISGMTFRKYIYSASDKLD